MTVSSSWVMWIDTWQLERNRPSQSGLRPLTTIDSPEVLSQLLSNIPLSSLSMNTSLSLFRNGVHPSWEDPHNINGGHFKVVALSAVHSAKLWCDLTLSLVNESFVKSHSVTGACVDVRPKGNSLKVWVSNAQDTELIQAIRAECRKLFAVEDCAPHPIAFVPHKVLRGPVSQQIRSTQLSASANTGNGMPPRPNSPSSTILCNNRDSNGRHTPPLNSYSPQNGYVYSTVTPAALAQLGSYSSSPQAIRSSSPVSSVCSDGSMMQVGYVSDEEHEGSISNLSYSSSKSITTTTQKRVSTPPPIFTPPTLQNNHYIGTRPYQTPPLTPPNQSRKQFTQFTQQPQQQQQQSQQPQPSNQPQPNANTQIPSNSNKTKDTRATIDQPKSNHLRTPSWDEDVGEMDFSIPLIPVQTEAEVKSPPQVTQEIKTPSKPTHNRYASDASLSVASDVSITYNEVESIPVFVTRKPRKSPSQRSSPGPSPSATPTHSPPLTPTNKPSNSFPSLDNTEGKSEEHNFQPSSIHQWVEEINIKAIDLNIQKGAIAT